MDHIIQASFAHNHPSVASGIESVHIFSAATTGITTEVSIACALAD
jgi:hypothetical protein